MPVHARLLRTARSAFGHGGGVKAMGGGVDSTDVCRGFRAELPVRPDYAYDELLSSPALTAVVWRVAAGLLPGQALPPVVLTAAEKGYRREKNIHDYAYSVFVSTYFESSEHAARKGVRRIIPCTGFEAEVCRFLSRFWQERSSDVGDQKTGGTGGARRYRLRRLWMTWRPELTPDFLEFVSQTASRYAAHDPALGWPAEVYNRHSADEGTSNE